MSEKTKSKYSVPNLERALEIVELLTEFRSGLSMSEIAAKLEIPKNSVFRITSTMLEKGYLQRDQDSMSFTLTRKFLAVGFAALSEKNLLENSLDVMRELRDKIKETVLVGTIVECEGVVLGQVAGTHYFNFRVNDGARFYLHTTAPGKAILAYMPQAQADKIIEKMKFPGFNERTIVSAENYRKELDRVRECGYGVDHEEQLAGCHCVAAPIFDEHAYPVAAIWTTGPSSRLFVEDFEPIAQVIKEHAMIISKRLGYDALGKKDV